MPEGSSASQEPAVPPVQSSGAEVLLSAALPRTKGSANLSIKHRVVLAMPGSLPACSPS